MPSSLDSDFLAQLTVKRLAELNKARARVDALELRSSLATEYEIEKRKVGGRVGYARGRGGWARHVEGMGR